MSILITKYKVISFFFFSYSYCIIRKNGGSIGVDYKLIGERIKSERKKCNLTQEGLAEKLDVSIGYVSQVERGITKISLDLLAEISTILKCDIAFLVTGSALNSDNYIKTELLGEISALEPQKRKLLFEFIKLLSKC